MTQNTQNIIKEHVATIFPFQIVEKVNDKPLRIRGIAITAGISRNFNIYTPQELEAFSLKLSGAPVYIEHVSVENAVGKVTKTEWDGHSLWYEAEIFESEVADKIRKGLVQHVSVGADYETIDTVDARIPHGLSNAELSLVAVPGIPETNISILESLAHCDERKVVKAGSCVFCSNQAHYLISSCKSCYGKLSATGIVAIKNSKNEALNYDEITLKRIFTETTNQISEELKNTLNKLATSENNLLATQNMLSVKNTELTETKNKLVEANKAIEQLKSPNLTDRLLKDPPRTIPISEAIGILKNLLPSPAVEHSTFGMQRECQAIRQAIYKLNAGMA